MYARVVGDRDDDQAYGTVDLDAPVPRAEFERAIRSLNMSDVDLRDLLLQLAARVVALTDELTRRLDGVEPAPAPPNTPAKPPAATIEVSVASVLDETLQEIRAADVGGGQRVSLDLYGENKYTVPSAGPPCAEIIHLCEARCCKLSFALSTADLDEGVIRWDYAQPYLIRQRESDKYCVHNDPGSHFCTVHEQRPSVCRKYDCRKDPRIWADFDKRVLAEMPKEMRREDKQRGGTAFDLHERARARALAVHFETTRLAESFGDKQPVRGPAPPKK